MSIEIVHQPDDSRYALLEGGDVVSVLDYALRDGAISFTHTFTRPSHRGRGLAADLVRFAVDDVEASSARRVVPMCWYVADWFDAHPERAGLLTR
ncbi:GNAT family N-acetyltransferase [Galbitalea sp. SE-J8]|uniref:GNAT family N-acetyltransferase n=1 Tax=Galbitalea sp. SE-J8 TaxID=3054952 RepID=UPI00259CA577|nr:GNAT family N-acetyltransferase [Galbitalea sp. SE-J8]MDM4763169.1 GNAT family N-acetyltransferase [Galbitalea sp. SE-J8]